MNHLHFGQMGTPLVGVPPCGCPFSNEQGENGIKQKRMGTSPIPTLFK
ncbi:MAG: hypothetical protein PVI26_01115 [Chitinispirillia bacterium]